ncbi:MAG TPA: cbb3-type cytochrome oxidase assembly protein CcoS [Spongiibacteraceae bacterium]|nr:cbb3-type cytochrome oxidase assembly protein CcoS [Spongiibacteraceae bacterium]
MQAIFFLIPLALIFCVLMVKAFFWAVSNRQFENLDSAAQSILFDEDERTGVNAQTDLNSQADTNPPMQKRDDETRP